MASQLRYQPLSENEFRLATLLPQGSSDQLRLEISHASLNASQLSYIALSYTWLSKLDSDDDDIEETDELIVVNGQEIYLHNNLAVALRCIRTDLPQCIWADALCIDQSNVIERSSQVMLMRKIFTRATTVLAWLGREAKDSNLAMDFLLHLARTSKQEHFGEWFSNEALQPSYYPTWEALLSLMSRSWWQRAWIVQEFALGPEVTFLCGDRRLSVKEFETADRALFVHFSTAKNELVTVLRRSVPINSRVFQPARNLLEVRRRLQRGERISALESLQMTRSTLATDPRDHLFAKLGLSDRELTDLCPPNYKIKAEDSWFVFFKTFIEKKKDLYIICLAGMQPRGYKALPSWLPDWGPAKPMYALCSFAHGDKPRWPYFDAAGGTEAVATISTNRMQPDSTLQCRGLLIDTVDGVAGDRWAAMPTIMWQSQYSENVYKTSLGSFEALCRVITSNTNRMDDWGPPPRAFGSIFAKRWRELNVAVTPYETDPSIIPLPLPLYESASGFEKAWRSMRGLRFGGKALRVVVDASLDADEDVASTLRPSERHLGAVAASSHPLWTALEHSAGQTCFDRSVFTTVQGYLGIGPATVVPGDKITVLFGCKVPVILREQGRRYHLIGETYVDGVMYGEVMAKLRDSPSTLRTEDLELI
ncbi:hypothetical protein NUW58_g299 [Xylaria curta]|uniref:Uncharacterized protein n=1 Tax=Xylaria curta TaxID=42375 RepID=A0ACC1PPV5_9PEZI|nr:hypothetical protein NUW58_g299 [Xylaria curta]